MGVRILHCSKNIENYNLCVRNEIAGFRNKGPHFNDIVYLVVKVNGKSFCGARGKLWGYKKEGPWEDAKSYKLCLGIDNIEFCKPFEINFLSRYGGKYWVLKYIRGNKILDIPASKALEKIFNYNLSNEFYDFEKKEFVDIKPNAKYVAESGQLPIKIPRPENKLIEKYFSKFKNKYNNYFIIHIDDSIYEKYNLIYKDTIYFKNILRYFNSIFLIFKPRNEFVFDINLLIWEKSNLEKKNSIIEKGLYFNNTVVPRIIQCAAYFSTFTKREIRDFINNNIVNIIIDYIFDDNILKDKVTKWMKSIDKNIKDLKIPYIIGNHIRESLFNNVKIILITDKLEQERDEMAKGMIGSYKNENNNSVKLEIYF